MFDAVMVENLEIMKYEQMNEISPEDIDVEVLGLGENKKSNKCRMSVLNGKDCSIKLN